MKQLIIPIIKMSIIHLPIIGDVFLMQQTNIRAMFLLFYQFVLELTPSVIKGST